MVVFYDKHLVKTNSNKGAVHVTEIQKLFSW